MRTSWTSAVESMRFGCSASGRVYCRLPRSRSLGPAVAHPVLSTPVRNPPAAMHGWVVGWACRGWVRGAASLGAVGAAGGAASSLGGAGGSN